MRHADTVNIGGIILGDGLQKTDGNDSSSSVRVAAATASTIGGIKIGDGLRINADGAVSINALPNLPIATTENLGIIKISNGLEVDASGAVNIMVGKGLKISEHYATPQFKLPDLPEHFSSQDLINYDPFNNWKSGLNGSWTLFFAVTRTGNVIGSADETMFETRWLETPYFGIRFTRDHANNTDDQFLSLQGTTPIQEIPINISDDPKTMYIFLTGELTTDGKHTLTLFLRNVTWQQN